MKRLILLFLVSIPLAYSVSISSAGEPDKKAIMKKLKEAVKSGEMTKAEAKAKLMAMKKKAGDHALKAKWEKMTGEIEEAVEAGKLTREEADEKLKWLKKRFAEYKKGKEGKADGKDDWKDDGEKKEWMEAMAKIKAAVKAGELTKREAMEKMKAMKGEWMEKKEWERDEDDAGKL